MSVKIPNRPFRLTNTSLSYSRGWKEQTKFPLRCVCQTWFFSAFYWNSTISNPDFTVTILFFYCTFISDFANFRFVSRLRKIMSGMFSILLACSSTSHLLTRKGLFQPMYCQAERSTNDLRQISSLTWYMINIYKSGIRIRMIECMYQVGFRLKIHVDLYLKLVVIGKDLLV